MKRLGWLALVCVSRTALAGDVSLSAGIDAPDTDAASIRRLTLRDQVVLDQPGVTAAFSVDPTIAEVSARNGKVTVIAVGVGATTISLVTAKDIISVPLTVVAPPRWSAVLQSEAAPLAWTEWQSQYESATARLSSSLEMTDGTGGRTLRAYAVNVLRLDRNTGDLDARTAFPAASLEWRRRGTEVVLLDKLIENSPLTLDGTTVRGAHLRVDGLEVHAGITSPLLYQNVFLARDAETVLGASYDIAAGSRSTLTPSVYAYPSAPTTGGTSGVMGSVLHRYHSADQRLQLRSELGYGGKLGAATELGYQDPVNRLWISARHQPRGFAAIGSGRPLGSMLDAMYNADPSKQLSVAAGFTAARYQTATTEQDLVTAMIESRIRLARHLSWSGGISSGQFAGVGMPETVRSLTVPIGLTLEGTHGSVAALYRYQSSSARNNGGHGGRLTARLRSGGLRMSAFADAQQEAASLELILRDEPQLAQLLEEMGLTASSPEDLARLVRENATLTQLGYADGVRLELDPWRVQVGGDLVWASRAPTRQQLRLRVLANRTHSVSAVEDTLTSSLAYSRQLGARVDATAMLSWWSHDSAMSVQPDQWSVAAGLRVRIDAVPRLNRSASRTITGRVVDDADAPVPGVIVRIDDGRTRRSDASGRFTFDRVGGDHDVIAELPADRYFASASRVTASPGTPVRFVLGRASAHLTVVVRDDAGQGMDAVGFELRDARGGRTARTESNGRLRLAAAPGEYELVPIPESVPPGYDTSTLDTMRVKLGTGAPVSREVVVRAERSISGVVRTRGAKIRIVELDRAAAIDELGRYVFRRVPSGTLTIEATTAEGRVITRRSIDIPMQPVVLRGIDIP